MELGTLLRKVPRAGVTGMAGAILGAGAGVAATKYYLSHDSSDMKIPSQAKMDKKLKKLQKQAQERIIWDAVDDEVLGLTPRLWMEAFDAEHRYAGVLYPYWRRWQLSDSRTDFFPWLAYGQGHLIDLPSAPRRLLSEWQVLYLTREQQALHRVKIQDGCFCWEFDGSPVNAPNPRFEMFKTISSHISGDDAYHETHREYMQAASFQHEGLQRALLRDGLLLEARRQVEQAQQNKEEPTKQRLTKIAEPLIEEGLLCQLRDPHFRERIDPATTPAGHAHLRCMPEHPKELLEGVTWDDFITALDHDQGLHMKEPFPSGEARLKDTKGMFVLDAFGQLYMGSKVRGMFHHSSFIRGHCVKVAGVCTIKDGKMKMLAPHSGHYQPSQQQVDRMIEDWKAQGVDFSQVELKPYFK
eukprot:TRINITY_DN37026_c0_g1_i1.p1 TRINITY_DN37026_c0_g1~~TRINITY_DN37026_c0_g1_i1.p1  ORF type:complete len:436 (+),score=74.35 TRINITY_DN37026_c0_g1_i1:74-1309(+)